MMALAAIPVAGVLGGGGVALAQTAGAPAGTAVVQQAQYRHQAQNQVTPQATAQQDRDCTGDQARDRDRVQDQDCLVSPVGGAEMTQAHHGEGWTDS